MNLKLDEIEDDLKESLLKVENEVIANRINFMLESQGFESRLKGFISNSVRKNRELPDNILQTFKTFLKENLEINGEFSLQHEGQSRDPGSP